MSAVRVLVLAGAVSASLGIAAAQTDQTQQKDLSNLGLEELMNVKVTTASKEAQSLSGVPAAVYVVTQEQIRRSGATSIPEVLRAVPGVQIQQLSPSVYSVSIRGMGGRYSDKLLVLMDGRTVYTPSFSGVYWDAQDIDLDLVDRIEVIRGPGGTLWGSNAINGIINIITKSAKDTLGTRASIRTGTDTPVTVDVSHGGQFQNGSYRVNARAFKTNGLDTILNEPGENDWSGLRGGFRADWTRGADSFSFIGDANSSHQGASMFFPTLSAPYREFDQDRFTTSGYDFVAKWERTEGRDKGTSLQASFEHYDRDMPEAGDRRTTFALDFQKPFDLAKNNHLIWGLGYNTSHYVTVPTPFIFLNPASGTNNVYSGFVQDEAKLNRKTTLSLGTKIEHNDFSGWEYQPSARIAYTPTEQQTWWAAVSRAVRTPSIGEIDSTTVLNAMPGQGGVPVLVSLVGNHDYDAETVVSSELGWRYAPSNRWYLDVATFYNHYVGLRGAAALAPAVVVGPPMYVNQTVEQGNDYSATTGGLELSTHWTATPKWSLDGAYALYTESFHLTTPGGNQLGDGAAGGDSAPLHQFSIRSQWDLAKHFEFDTTAYYVGGLQETPRIAPYARLDMRLGWKPNAHTEYSIGGTNLTNQNHVEGIDTPYALASEIRRAFYAKATFKF
jgi:iron complex outermembrane receptor protein